MKHWIKIIFFIFGFSSLLLGQSNFDISYNIEAGLNIGVDHNNFPSLELRKGTQVVSLQSSFLLTNIRENFFGISYQKMFHLKNLKLIPQLQLSSNLISGDENISATHLDLGLLYQLKKVDILFRPYYSLNNEIEYSGGLSFAVNENLKILTSYGTNYKLINTEKSASLSFQYIIDKIILRSGIEFPEIDDKRFARIVTSFRYRI